MRRWDEMVILGCFLQKCLVRMRTGVNSHWVPCCCSHGIHGDIWQLCTSKHERVPTPLGAHLQSAAGWVAAAGDVTDIHTVMFLLHGLVSEFWGSARQVSVLRYDSPEAERWCNSKGDYTFCFSLYTKVCLAWPVALGLAIVPTVRTCTTIKCTCICFSTDGASSSPKETPGQPPALPPKRSRTSSVKSSASPPPMSPPPTSRPQQELYPKLNHLVADGDTNQTRCHWMLLHLWDQ